MDDWTGGTLRKFLYVIYTFFFIIFFYFQNEFTKYLFHLFQLFHIYYIIYIILYNKTIIRYIYINIITKTRIKKMEWYVLTRPYED